MASASNFRYTPLEDPENCLRLLQLLPEENNDDDLYATLTTFQRDAAPAYRPVSYTWGTEKPSSQLLIQSHGQQDWEFVLSGDKDFWIGSRHQTFQPLISLILFFKKSRLYLGVEEKDTNFCKLDPDCPHYLESPEIDAIDRLERLWSGYLSSQAGDVSGRTLEYLLDKFSGFESYDPRDGIYAFLSMASDIDSSEWFPDYSDQNWTISLYSKATLHIMSHGTSLDIIGRHAHNFAAEASANYVSSWIPWFGPQAQDFAPFLYGNRQKVQQDDQRGPAQPPPHIHLLHGYNTRSFTTFGQFLQRLNPDHEEWMDCADFDFCHACARTSDTTHDPSHRFRYHNGAVYFASGGPGNVCLPTEFPLSGPHDPQCPVVMNFAGLIVDKIIQMGPLGETQMIHGVKTFEYKFGVELSPELPGMERYINSDGVLDDTILRVMTGNRRVSGGVVCHVTDSWIVKARQFFRIPHFTPTKIDDERCLIPDEITHSPDFLNRTLLDL
ncbi:HET-domain-containing protein [Apiospora arundinis]